MRLVKIILLLALIAGVVHVIGSAVASDTKATSISVAPKSPVAATCRVIAGKTVVRVAAIDDISSVGLSFADGQSIQLLPNLQKGWSIAQTVSGVHQSVTVTYVWRGAAGKVPVPCQ